MFNKIADALSRPSTQLFIAVAAIASFVLSYWLIQRDNFFFSGDMGINGLIVRDFQRFAPHSYYFYGQNYFGNLEHVFLAALGIITGISLKTMCFWEHFFYLTAVILLLSAIPRLPRVLAVLFPFFFFFTVNYLPYTFAPQGFAFVLLIIAAFFLLYKHIWRKQTLSAWHFGVTGLFTTLSLWHNATYAFILPVFLILVLLLRSRKTYSLRGWHLVCLVTGALLGLLPLIGGTLETHGENLKWFLTHRDGGTAKTILYYLNDFFYNFQSTAGSDSHLKFMLGKVIQNGMGFNLSLAVLVLFMLSLKYWRAFLVELLFLGFLTLTVISRGLDRWGVFDNVRYSMPVYAMLVTLVFGLITKCWDTQFREADVWQKGVKLIGWFVIAGLLLVGITGAADRYSRAYHGPQIYDDVLRTLKKEDVHYVYCFNFYEVCATLAFLGDEDLAVQIIDTDVQGNAIGRNPSGRGSADQAISRGQRVISIIKDPQLRPWHHIISSFSYGLATNRYYLIEGSYK